MTIVLFGWGSIGKRHADILRRHWPAHKLYVFRSRPAKPNALGLPELRRWSQVKALKADAAFITNPTHRHVPTALRCARLGMHLFIEKPLSDRMAGVAALKGLCRRKRLSCYVAYCLRFHPVIKRIKTLLKGKMVHHARVVCASHLGQWRPKFNKATSYSAHRRMGGGVILDLSHEFDYVAYLFGGIRRLQASAGRRAKVTVDAEDYVDALVETRSGVPVNVHVNFLSEHLQRTIDIDVQGGFIHGDLNACRLDYIYRGRKQSFAYAASRNRHLLEQTRYFFKHLGRPMPWNGLDESAGFLRQMLTIRP